MSQVIFFVLAFIAVASALLLVTRKSPLTSALYLIVTMCSLAGLFALLGAIFLAALQVIVYAGAIMVLFLFVIMLLNLRTDEFSADLHKMQKYLGMAFALIILLQTVFIVVWATNDFPSNAKMTTEFTQGIETPIPDSTADYSSAETVAETLFTQFSYPFEITSILLLAAIVGAVVIAKRKGFGEPGEEKD